MKKLILIYLTFACMYANAQTKAIELADLIKMFTPDSLNLVGNWKTGAGANSPVKWNAPLPKIQGTKMYKQGAVNIQINKQPTICMNAREGNETACKWKIELNGTQSGYNSFILSAADFHIEEQSKIIETLFPQCDYEFKQLIKPEDDILYWVCTYQIKIQGKKTIFMRVEFSSGTASASSVGIDSYTMTFFLDKIKAMK